MIDVIAFETLGRMNIDWLSARYHFSFADYHDPARMGFGPLRVWNDDTIRPQGGFPMHPHRDMEILNIIKH
jgi:quercetin 2,3-dioxygenase